MCACYQLVKSDRVGRMADTREFENSRTDKRQIDPALMPLRQEAAREDYRILGNISSFAISIERRMVPLIWAGTGRRPAVARCDRRIW